MKHVCVALALPLIAALALITLSTLGAAAAPASCPYSGGGPPYRFWSWEAERDRARYLDALQLAAHNELLPHDEAFALPALERGVGGERREDPRAVIPAPILYAIAWVESSTNQTALDVPYGSIGPTLLSFDCGYGIMQVTSTIVNEGGLPTRYEALVGSHFAYNIAAGARILVEKWNDEFYPVVGGNDPSSIESWYYALWAYNGWAASNHPLGPDADPSRSAYRCDGRRSGYPYQELVLGCIAHPPQIDGRPLWEAVEVQLPDLAELAAPGSPLDPALFYEGWNTLRSIDYAVEDGASPFRSMDLPATALAAEAYAAPGLSAAAASERRALILGAPQLELDTEELELASSTEPNAAATLLIGNRGSGLLPWRVASAPSWLEVEISAGVAVGAGGTFATATGAASTLLLRTAAAGVPEGEHIGELLLEVTLPSGAISERAVTVFLNKLGAAFYRAGTPQS